MNQSKNLYQICYIRALGQEGGGGGREKPNDNQYGEAPERNGVG